ncbi:AraC family transcriptional regulator [Paractinoplanes toevensis]|uniref:AraC family transcriptional regulator n=1 Tax=Paractinoplanes toevensis TaxID=571911 RepID=A0A919T5E5_9ACTN|nr:AraC family transcriptional regulator [Actinoplanes toevensis]
MPHVIAWWSVTGPGARESRILPDGCLDIIWKDGRVFVAGPDTTAQIGRPVLGSRMFALRFSAGTGPPVLGVPASELVDQQVPLDALWSSAAVRRLAESSDPMAALTEAARSRWATPDPVMVALAAASSAGRPIDAIAADCGFSPRQLLRRSNAAFGYGPKVLARILRMQRAVGMARAGLPFAAVSASAGYADQAHLAREVRAMAGVPLGSLISS